MLNGQFKNEFVVIRFPREEDAGWEVGLVGGIRVGLGFEAES